MPPGLGLTVELNLGPEKSENLILSGKRQPCKSQEDENYALLSKATFVLKNFTDEGLIFASCDCILISMKSELQVKEKDLLTVMGENSE